MNYGYRYNSYIYGVSLDFMYVFNNWYKYDRISSYSFKRYYKGLGVLHRINDEVDNEEKNKVETEKER